MNSDSAALVAVLTCLGGLSILVAFAAHYIRRNPH